MKSNKTIEKEIGEITTRLFAYGIDWTEFKDKSPDDHEVSTYAAKIKQEFADTVASEIMQAIKAHALTVAERLIGKDEPETGLGKRDGEYDQHIARNQLRAELRTAFTKYYEGEM